MTDQTLNDLIESFAPRNKGFTVNVPRGTKNPTLPLSITAREYGCVHILDARGLPVWDVSVLEGVRDWNVASEMILEEFEGFNC